MQASVFLTKERARHCLINTARYHDYYRINVKNQPTSTLIEIIQLLGFPQLTYACSKSTIETLRKGVKYV